MSRDAENEVEPLSPTPVKNLRRAIMAIAAQEDFGSWPVGADRAQETAQKRANLLAAWPLGGAQNGRDEAALAVERHDRLESVFVIMGIEQSQLLAAVNRVKCIVDVEHDPFGSLLEGVAIQVDHGAAHAQQGAGVRQVFQSGNGRLRAQFAIGRRQIKRHFEHGIASQGPGVIAVLIAGADHQQAKADDVSERVGDQVRRARIDQASGQPIGDAKTLLDLAQD